MKVRFLGGKGARSITPSLGADPVPVGDVAELTPGAIAAMRAHGYRFEPVEDEETLPEARQDVPESVQREQRRQEIQRLREDTELEMLRQRERQLEGAGESADAGQQGHESRPSGETATQS